MVDVLRDRIAQDFDAVPEKNRYRYAEEWFCGCCGAIRRNGDEATHLSCAHPEWILSQRIASPIDQRFDYEKPSCWTKGQFIALCGTPVLVAAKQAGIISSVDWGSDRLIITVLPT